MKNFKKLSLTILACSILAACGSSNKSDANKSMQPSKPSVNNEQSNTNSQPTTKLSNEIAQPAQKSNTTGSVYIISGRDNNVTKRLKRLNDASDLNFIIVDGQKIRVSYQDLGTSSGGWTAIQNSLTCCGSFSDLRFGVIGSNNEKESDYFFYNGNPTKAMPTSGKAVYTGGFAITGNTKQFEDEDYLRGNAKFQADFAAKTLTGTLTEPTLQPIDIKAKVNGNSFTGTATSKDFATQAEVEGKFYGSNAKELGGLFKDNKSWGGAFGGSQ